MSKLTISEAARQIPISRTNLYKNYINTGRISIEKDEKGKPRIDVSEILRVFPGLQGRKQNKTIDYTQENKKNTEVLEERIRGLEALLFAKDEIIASQKQQLLLLTVNQKKKRFLIFG